MLLRKQRSLFNGMVNANKLNFMQPLPTDDVGGAVPGPYILPPTYDFSQIDVMDCPSLNQEIAKLQFEVSNGTANAYQAAALQYGLARYSQMCPSITPGGPLPPQPVPPSEYSGGDIPLADGYIPASWPIGAGGGGGGAAAHDTPVAAKSKTWIWLLIVAGIIIGYSMADKDQPIVM